MKSIYTSCFNNYRKFPENSLKISIARFTKKEMKVDLELLDLAPSTDLLFSYKENKINEEQYKKRYLEELKKLSFNIIIKFLLKELENKDVILLCYENKNSFCHRHILRELLNKILTRNKSNVIIKEL